MLIDKKLNFEVKTKTESLNTITLQLTPLPDEGIQYASPSEGIFVIVPKDQVILNVGDIVLGLIVGQFDDGQ
jgi:hypothetical protein